MKSSKQQQENCLEHKQRNEFLCSNKNCPSFGEKLCPKDVSAIKMHENCELLSLNESSVDLDSELISTFLRKWEKLTSSINEFLSQGKIVLINELMKNRESANECANDIIFSIDEYIKSDLYYKRFCVSDIWTALEEFLEEQENDVISEQSKEILSFKSTTLQSFSQSPQQEEEKSQQSSSESLIEQPLQKDSLDEDQSFSSMKSSQLLATPSSVASSQKSSKVPLNSCSKKDYQLSSSIQNIKGKKGKQFKIDSKYVENFCIFELQSFNIDEGNVSLNQLFKSKHYLITRCEKQSMQVVDLDLQREINRISFTHDSEIIYFKQISQREVIIYGQKMSYIWIQDIFDEKNFQQIDFPFKIDCLACDLQLGLIFCAHQSGKISIWSIQSQNFILNGFKAHNKAISVMDVSNQMLVTCCKDGSVKEFSFPSNVSSIKQVRVLVAEDQKGEDSLEEKPTYVKIINSSTILVQISDEFIEIYKNGSPYSENKDNALEYFLPMEDMKIYEQRYGFLRSEEEEFLTCLYDFNKCKALAYFTVNEDKAIIGSYFINGQVVQLQDDQNIQFFS